MFEKLVFFFDIILENLVELLQDLFFTPNLIVNAFTADTFLSYLVDFSSYADDNAPYSTGKCNARFLDELKWACPISLSDSMLHQLNEKF